MGRLRYYKIDFLNFFLILKIPYELMNKKFRCTQRVIDQCIFHFHREFQLLEQKLKGRTQPISMNEVRNQKKY